MKILIWIACIFGISFVNILIQYAIGFGLGPILLIPLIFFVARTLCDAWDRSRGKGKFNVDQSKLDPTKEWFCTECATINPVDKKSCINCGVTRQYAESNKAGSNRKAAAPVTSAQSQYPAAEAGATTVLSAPDAGETTVLSAPEAGQTTVLNESGFLKLHSDSLNSEVRISKTMCAVGTAPEADLNLSHLPQGQYISGRHALLVYSGGAWYIRDEGSSNGTQLNGFPLEAQLYYPLSVGDVISFAGKEQLTVVELA